MPAPLRLTSFGGEKLLPQRSQLAPSEARDSLNLSHSHPREAKPRRPIDRVWATQPNGAVPVLAAWELVKPSGPTTVRMVKQGNKLYSFALTPGTALTELLTGLDATHIPGVANANGCSFIANYQAANYITDGTAAHTHALQNRAYRHAHARRRGGHGHRQRSRHDLLLDQRRGTDDRRGDASGRPRVAPSRRGQGHRDHGAHLRRHVHAEADLPRRGRDKRSAVLRRVHGRSRPRRSGRGPPTSRRSRRLRRTTSTSGRPSRRRGSALRPTTPRSW